MGYNAGGEITGLWNGLIFDSRGFDYIIKNAGHNYEIMPNGSVSFGYTLKGDDLAVPDKFEICSERVGITDGYSVQLVEEDK